jgi:hypothetical protein
VLRLKVPDTATWHVAPNVTRLELLMDMPPESTRRALPDPNPVMVAYVIVIDPPVRRTVLLSPVNVMYADDVMLRPPFRVADNRAPVLHTPFDIKTPFSTIKRQSFPARRLYRAEPSVLLDIRSLDATFSPMLFASDRVPVSSPSMLPINMSPPAPYHSDLTTAVTPPVRQSCS